MTRSDYFRPVSGGISGLCVEPDDNPLSELWQDKVLNGFRVIIVTYLPIVSEPGAGEQKIRGNTYLRYKGTREC